MSVYIDRKFLMLLSSRLRNFKTRKEDLYNFSCPYCGDSSKKTTKARGYVYRKANDYFFMCHNCNVSTTFGKFLEFMDSELIKAYKFENYADKGYGKNKWTTTSNVVSDLQEAETIKPLNISDFKDNIGTLPDGHYAKEYIRNRKIPQEFWSEIFFVEHYASWLDKYFPDHGKEESKLVDDARIVMFYTDQHGTITSVSGRALQNSDKLLRYITVKIRDEKKVFGLHRLNPLKPIYIVEGQFDSMFLPNCLASGDANLLGLALYVTVLYPTADIVLVYDNQPRNKDIVRQMQLAIKDGWDVTFLPYDPDAKDINELVKIYSTMNTEPGTPLEQIKKLIDDNRCGGLTAHMELSKWRKC
jgi:hypothetical protein